MIKGVVAKKLVINKGKKGIFIEIIRQSDKFFSNCQFAQLSHSIVDGGVIKAWHLHKKQTDFIYCAKGKIKLVLFDTRKGSTTYGKLREIILGKKNDQKAIKIPPGVAHGYKVINGQAHIIYLMNREYDPDDELRIPHDDSKIGYNWLVD